ncbi:26836_t:CDS:1, partial [Gigaspora margarita]
KDNIYKECLEIHDLMHLLLPGTILKALFTVKYAGYAYALSTIRDVNYVNPNKNASQISNSIELSLDQ